MPASASLDRKGSRSPNSRTVAVTRYKERNLLERATYKFEAVFKAGNTYKIEPLGEISIHQGLRPDTAHGARQGDSDFEPRARPSWSTDWTARSSKSIRREWPRSLPETSSPHWKPSSGTLSTAWERATPKSKTPRAKAILKAEQADIVQTDKDAAERAAPPASDAGGPDGQQGNWKPGCSWRAFR